MRTSSTGMGSDGGKQSVDGVMCRIPGWGLVSFLQGMLVVVMPGRKCFVIENCEIVFFLIV